MDGHLTYRTLARLFSGVASQPEAEAAVVHLRACRLCWRLAASVVIQLRSEGALNAAGTAAQAVLSLIDEELHQVVEALSARSWWFQMRDESPARQRERLRSVAALQTRSFFKAVLEDSEKLAPQDPLRGEQGALLARDLAAILPPRAYPEDLRRDLQGEAMTVAANCRRLGADWQGALAAITEAREFLRQGSGDPRRQARLLSIHASLASDTANTGLALDLLSRAAAIYRQEGDAEGLARTLVQEAAALQAGGKAAEAMARAEEVLALGTASVSARLQMLAKSIVTESLIELNRPSEALLSYSDTLPLYEQFSSYDLRVAKLAGRLLDSLGSAREAEKMLRRVVQGNLDAENYKEAFLTLYVLVEAFFKRGVFEKAAQVCEEAIEILEAAGSAAHAQMRDVWRELLALVRRRSLTAAQVLAVRQYLARYWSVPASRSPFNPAKAEPAPAPVQLLELTPAPAAEEESFLAAVEPPPIPAILSAEAYTDALDRFDRELIAAALAQCGGSIRGTTRLLRVSRTTLRSKIKKYGLSGTASE